MLCSRLQLSLEAVSNHYVSDERAMAFLPKFETDIFISYARVDNETATGGEGWVAQFVKHLEIELRKLAGRIGLVKLWWEPTGKN